MDWTDGFGSLKGTTAEGTCASEIPVNEARRAGGSGRVGDRLSSWDGLWSVYHFTL